MENSNGFDHKLLKPLIKNKSNNPWLVLIFPRSLEMPYELSGKSFSDGYNRRSNK